MHLFVMLYIFPCYIYECAEPTSVTTELTLTCSANRAFTATSQEGLLLGTYPSDLWQFSRVSLAFLD